jgi:glycosyltransferase involved in cell wall biosynthesis
MNILQFHNKVPYPPKDGGAIGVWNFSVELAKQGHNLTLFCMNTRKHYFDINSIPSEYQSLFKIETVYVDTTASWFHAATNLLFSCTPYNAQRFISSAVKKKLAQLLNENNYDLIQIEGLYCMPYLSLIRKYSDALISFKSHNIEHEIWERIASNSHSFLKRKYLKILTKRIRRMEFKALQKADVNISVTQRDADYIAEISDIPVHVAPAGINLNYLVPSAKEPVFPSLFFLGALDWEPNQEGILWFVKHVLPELIRAGITCPLEIAGRNCPFWLQEKLKNIPQLVFHGEIENAYSFMNERALMIVPLFSGSGMRVKIIEGMALGKTIISTTIGAEGIHVTHNKNIFLVDSVESFKTIIIELMQNQSKINETGINARKFVMTNYDISNIVRNLVNFWEKHKRT